MQQTQFEFEKKRKAFHMLSLFLPILYMFNNKPFMLILLFFITLITLAVDISRYYNHKIKVLVSKIFSNLMRKEENNSFVLTGASFMMLGFFISALCFPKNLVIISWIVFIISDALAAIIGVKIGQTKINDKSLEGSIAFFISSLFISMISYFFFEFNVSFYTILITSLIITLLELYSKEIQIDDNLSIPFVYCLANVTINFLARL